MKAAVLYEYNAPLKIEDLELDEPRSGEVLVKMVASGVCHSDYREIKGEWQNWELASLPVVLGHEGAGVVERVGEGVTSVKPGDHVILVWFPPCGECHYCMIGSPAYCDNPILFKGDTRLHKGKQRISHYYGVSSFAEFAVVPESGAIPIPKDVPLEGAALMGCCVPTGVGAVINTAQVKAGSTVAVFGCGGVGLNIIQGAALAGAKTIIAVDVQDNHLDFARQFGATHTVNASQGDAVEAIKKMTGGEGVEYAFEAIGNPETMAQTIMSTRKMGTACIVGQAPDGAILSFPAMLLYDERKIIGSMYGSINPRIDMPLYLDMYLNGKLKLDELVTRTYPLDEINSAFEAMEKGEVARSVITF